MSQPASGLSFGATSVASLIGAVRTLVDDDRSIAWDQLANGISQRIEQLIQANTDMAQDAPSGQWLFTCSMVLAAYEHLKPLAGSARVIASFRDAMSVPFNERIAEYLQGRFGISQDAPGDAFSQIAQNFKRRGEARFGLAFRYAEDVNNDTMSFTNIERCFFNDFFRRNGAPEVTPLFCALDKVWADALARPPYQVRFERPTTLAQGDDACRFQFHKRPEA